VIPASAEFDKLRRQNKKVLLVPLCQCSYKNIAQFVTKTPVTKCDAPNKRGIRCGGTQLLGTGKIAGVPAASAFIIEYGNIRRFPNALHHPGAVAVRKI
jgi:hypothetical protein